jgi:tetratricopeptide (TPR) repeat protein
MDGGREVWKTDGIYSRVSFSPDGQRLAAAFAMVGGVRVWEVDGWREVWKADGIYSDVSFSRDGRRVALGGSRGVRLADADSGREVWKADGAYTAVSFSSDGRRLAAGGLQGVRVWEVDNGRELWKTGGDCRCLSFSPDRPLLAVGGPFGLQLFGGFPEWSSVQDFRRRGIEANRVNWHEQRAAESESASNRFAAEFHRRWLVRIQPTSGSARFQHGGSLARLGRLDEAKREFVTALEMKPSLPPLTAADCHAMLGQWKEAAELYSAEMTPKQTNWQVWLRFAELALVSSGPAEYRSACGKMVKQFGAAKRADVANSTAWVCALVPDALPDMNLAVGLARLAVKAEPTNANARNTLGAVLYRTGKHDEAVTELTAAIKLSTKGGTWADHLFLAMAQHKLGKTDEAMKLLAAAEKLLDSDSAWFWSDKLERQLLRDEATKLIRGK